jgi:hypothetical protein
MPKRFLTSAERCRLSTVLVAFASTRRFTVAGILRGVAIEAKRNLMRTIREAEREAILARRLKRGDHHA